MASRWDFIHDLKPVSLSEHLVEEVSKLLCKDLGAWPPEIESWEASRDEARFRKLFEPGAKRPDDKVFTVSFRLARLELLREYEQIDEFMRNERWRDFAEPGYDYEAMIFLSKYMTEEMLGIAEMTQGRIKRVQLVDCLLRAERKLLAGRVILPS